MAIEIHKKLCAIPTSSQYMMEVVLSAEDMQELMKLEFRIV